MVMAAINYEYVPYYVPAPDPDYQDLLPPSEEDFDALSEFIPLASIKVTFFAPVIEFETADHPHFVPKKGKLYRKHKVKLCLLLTIFILKCGIVTQSTVSF